MSEQPEALRLADALANLRRWHELTDDESDEAAAELRRLHAVNQELLEALKYHQEQTRPIERTPTPAQEREHLRLRQHKVSVFVIDNVDAGKECIDMMVGAT